MSLVLIAAVARNGVIGRDNQLPWRLPEDMKRFKALTLNHAVIMGRRTWESLPSCFRPLPGRRNIVVTRDAAFRAQGAIVTHSIEEAMAVSGDSAFVIGGADIYRQALPLASRLELTEVQADFEGDAFFPSIDRADWVETARQRHRAEAGFDYDFVTYVRQ